MVDLDEQAAAPTSVLTERALLRGYSRVGLAESISRSCACGTVVVAVSGADADVELAVRDHRETPAHRAWAARWRSP